MEKQQQQSNQNVPVQRSSTISPSSGSSFANPMRIFDELFRGMLPSNDLLAVPRVDIEDRDDEYFVTFDIPGVPRENIEVEIAGNQLTVTAERQVDDESSKLYGAYQRTLVLPSSMDTEQIRAEYDNGVLALHIPRSEKSRPRKIDVEGKSTKNLEGNPRGGSH